MDSMEMIALSKGEPAWVLGADASSTAVSNIARAADTLVRVAAGLDGGRAGWEGEGLEYCRLPLKPTTTLSGFAENEQVTFWIELLPPGCFDGSEWEVSDSVSVRCDHEVDDGMHVIEQRELRPSDAEGAAAALAEVAGWLLARSQQVHPSHWRGLDVQAARH